MRYLKIFYENKIIFLLVLCFIIGLVVLGVYFQLKHSDHQYILMDGVPHFKINESDKIIKINPMKANASDEQDIREKNKNFAIYNLHDRDNKNNM